MSSYITFYKKDNTKLVYLFSKSRNTALFEIFEPYTSWGKITELSDVAILEIKNQILNDIDKNKKHIKDCKERISLIKGNLDEDIKEIYLSDLESLPYYKEEIRNLKSMLAYVEVIEDIRDEAVWSENRPLWLGYEAPSGYFKEKDGELKYKKPEDSWEDS